MGSTVAPLMIKSSTDTVLELSHTRSDPESDPPPEPAEEDLIIVIGLVQAMTLSYQVS